MAEEKVPRDIMVLGAIKRGTKKFDKIIKATKIEPDELDSILERLEERGLIRVEEKKGWLGKKIELESTEKGDRELEERIHELQTKWNQMSTVYKTGNKEKMKQYMDDNRSFLPMMMFFGVMDIMMFSMMFSMMGASMSDYVPAGDIPEGMGDGGGADAGADGAGDGGGIMDGGDGGGGFGDGGGFDFDLGF